MLLTMKDQQRIEAIQAVMDERFKVGEVGRVLNLSERQIYRMLKRLREEGLEGNDCGRFKYLRIKKATCANRWPNSAVMKAG